MLRSAFPTHELEVALSAPVARIEAIPGGDINQAFRVTLAPGRTVFVKARTDAPEGMFRREAEGLAWLAEARALTVPDVLAVGPAWLALSWVDTGPRPARFEEDFGRGLARLHRTHPPSFGLAKDNFIGPIPQSNQPTSRWYEFYRDQRLRPLAARCTQRGLLSRALLDRLDRVCRKLPELVGDEEPPARVHGDLWAGNVMCSESGAPVIIDPAVYGGHREVDLAMLCLFGSPSQRFFDAYEEVYPLQPGYRARLGLYQLYPLLVHVALFGQSYVPQLEAALA